MGRCVCEVAQQLEPALLLQREGRAVLTHTGENVLFTSDKTRSFVWSFLFLSHPIYILLPELLRKVTGASGGLWCVLR